MKNLIIFSSMTPTKSMVQEIQKFVKNETIGYIPASYYDFGYKSANPFEYWDMGFKTYFPFPVGRYFDKNDIGQLMECDAIHLGGGNTFEFLNLLRKRGMLPRLREYVENGGLLMGTSAGGIMMCNTIEIAGFADDNFILLDELEALGLVDFDVKPHWDAWEKEKDSFKEYANKNHRRVIGLREGQSIFVQNDTVKYYGGKPEVIDPD